MKTYITRIILTTGKVIDSKKQTLESATKFMNECKSKLKGYLKMGLVELTRDGNVISYKQVA